MPNKLTSVLGIAVLSAAAMILVMQTWVTLVFADGAAAFGSLAVPGQSLHAGLMPISLAGLASALALTIAGPIFRRILGLILSALGLGVVWLTVAIMTNTRAAVASSVAEATGLSGSGQADLVSSLTTTWALPATVVAGGLLMLAGIMVLFASGGWQSGGRKYAASTDAGNTQQAPGDDEDIDRFDDWDRQSGGDDPTV